MFRSYFTKDFDEFAYMSHLDITLNPSLLLLDYTKKRKYTVELNFPWHWQQIFDFWSSAIEVTITRADQGFSTGAPIFEGVATYVFAKFPAKNPHEIEKILVRKRDYQHPLPQPISR